MSPAVDVVCILAEDILWEKRRILPSIWPKMEIKCVTDNWQQSNFGWQRLKNLLYILIIFEEGQLIYYSVGFVFSCARTLPASASNRSSRYSVRRRVCTKWNIGCESHAIYVYKFVRWYIVAICVYILNHLVLFVKICIAQFRTWFHFNMERHSDKPCHIPYANVSEWSVWTELCFMPVQQAAQHSVTITFCESV